MTDSSEEFAACRLVDLYAEGWNAMDGSQFARPFADDAEFTNILGLTAHGKQAIADGHNEIFSTTFYRGTRLTATIESIRFIRPDIAILRVRSHLEYGDGRTFPAKGALAGIIAAKDKDIWSIAFFQNMIPFERPLSGPVERSLSGQEINS